MKARWYFDFISPFAYLQFRRFDRLPPSLEIEPVPVLFAGLLSHWGQLGPAEIAEKRLHTYRYTAWRAARDGIPMRFPPAHPFNPLHALRLCIALGSPVDVVGRIFDHIWSEGVGVDSTEGWRALCDTLGCADADGLIADPEVKAALRTNTETAVAEQIFGVPTFRIGGENFWGDDSTDMVVDFVADPALFERGELARASTVPVGRHRRRDGQGGAA